MTGLPSIQPLAEAVAEANIGNGFHDRWNFLQDLDDETVKAERIVSKLALIGAEEVRDGRMGEGTWHTINGEQVYRATDGSGTDWTSNSDGSTVDFTRALVPAWTGVPAKPEGLPSELVDIIFRTLDLAIMLGIDLDQIMAEKLDHNRSRGFMHGKLI